MRYDKQVTFVKALGTHYDPDLGEEVNDGTRLDKRLAHVVTPTMSKSKLVFGDLRSNQVVLHLKQPYKNTYDYCLINGVRYFFVTQKQVGRRQIILLEGDSDGSNA
ncbi:hypothetical protein GKC32_10755 (plasmid) [Lactobacillus curvatus]|nr:hypothetical protein [Latilactobacillus curvatus]MSD84717.1 hypothetical protein [Latilactobacillus curvatus]MSE23453.1 hypothetical protein [Latilactobacillus curvatus]MSE24917.1 hypothetical protein [Latilactobacillus curvatus]